MRLADYGIEEINVNELPESAEFKPIPAGKYEVIVKSVELKKSNKGNGSYFNIAFEVQGGEYDGRIVFGRFIYVHEKMDVQDRGRAYIHIMLNANKVDGRFDNSDLLLNARVLAKVVVKEDEGYEPRNDVSYVQPLSNPAPASSASRPATASASATPTASAVPPKKPWG